MTVFGRILVAFLFLLALAVGVTSYFVIKDLKPRYREATEEPLVDIANVLSGLIAAKSPGAGLDVSSLRGVIEHVRTRKLNAQIYGLEKTGVDLRVYVTDQRGIVLYDSEGGRAEGEDYSRWHDVNMTLKGRYGARTTRDDPQNPFSSVLYVAAPIKVDGKLLGVLSVESLCKI